MLHAGISIRQNLQRAFQCGAAQPAALLQCFGKAVAATIAQLLAGGGIGVAPLFGLSKRLLAAGKTPVAVLGFNTAEDVFYENEFKALGVQTVIATADGSRGTRGFVTDALPERFDAVCACGPMPMLKALCAKTDKPGQISLEARMGCGFGACMGCTIDTVNGPKRVCREGPVFGRDEIKW